MQQPDDSGEREARPESRRPTYLRLDGARCQTPALNSAQAFCQSVWPVGVSSVSGIPAVEVALAHDRRLEVRRDDAVSHEPVRIELGERRHGSRRSSRSCS